MKILLIADTHSVHYKKWTEVLNVGTNSIKMIVLLGDIYEQNLKQIKETFINIPIIGVQGNHDKLDTFENIGIINMHCMLSKKNNTTIIGIEGSLKYKQNNMYPLYSKKK